MYHRAAVADLSNIPHVLHLSRRVPLPCTISTHDVEIIQQPPKYESHLHVRQMLPNTASRAQREGLSTFLVVSVVSFVEIPLGNKGVAVSEISRIMCR